MDLSKNPKAWLTGDWHLGSRFHDAPLFARHFQQALEGDWSLLHTGDALEMVTVSAGVAQKGAMKDQVLNPKEQRKLLKDTLALIKAPSVILPGNHEFRIDAKTGLDFMSDVCEGIPNVTAMEIPGVVAITAGSQSYHLLLHHGEGPTVSPVTLFDRLQRDFEGVDLIACGHIHRNTSDSVLVRNYSGHKVLERKRVGHYLTLPAYAQVRPVAPPGAPGSWFLEFGREERWIKSTWLD